MQIGDIGKHLALSFELMQIGERFRPERGNLPNVVPLELGIKGDSMGGVFSVDPSKTGNISVAILHITRISFGGPSFLSGLDSTKIQVISAKSVSPASIFEALKCPRTEVDAWARCTRKQLGQSEGYD